MPPRYPPPKKGHLPHGFCMPKLPDLVPVVLCAPSGGGKTSLMNRLLNEFPQFIAHSVSHTTRKPRPNEINGIDYHFVDDATMKITIESGQLLEYIIFAGNTYGTTKKTVDDILQSGKICILTIDITGCDAIRKTYKGAKLIFIMPPSKNDLEKRILAREGTEENLKERLDRADAEIANSTQPGKFDLILENEDFDTCYHQLVQFLSDLLKLAKDKQAFNKVKERVAIAKEKRQERNRKQSTLSDNCDLLTGDLTSGFL